jgi:hypothetical protein
MRSSLPSGSNRRRSATAGGGLRFLSTVKKRQSTDESKLGMTRALVRLCVGAGGTFAGQAGGKVCPGECLARAGCLEHASPVRHSPAG